LTSFGSTWAYWQWQYKIRGVALISKVNRGRKTAQPHIERFRNMGLHVGHLPPHSVTACRLRNTQNPSPSSCPA
jgi:hypothetical protein